ncbi:MAG: GtrA family protein [Alphaproteobacteria bacterium]|nr:GtrA family protein [Alphaproteobacteria bacterium]
MIARLPPFFRFAFVGTLGFGLDLAVLWASLNVLGLDRSSARLVCFAVVVTFTWAMNRQLTFPERRAHGPLPVLREWAHFVTVNSVGLGVNYAVYAAMISFGTGLFASPYVAAGGGAIAGLFFNYLAASRLVFRTAPGG